MKKSVIITTAVHSSLHDPATTYIDGEYSYEAWINASEVVPDFIRVAVITLSVNDTINL